MPAQITGQKSMTKEVRICFIFLLQTYLVVGSTLSIKMKSALSGGNWRFFLMMYMN